MRVVIVHPPAPPCVVAGCREAGVAVGTRSPLCPEHLGRAMGREAAEMVRQALLDVGRLEA